jgi:hypothetical protein
MSSSLLSAPIPREQGSARHPTSSRIKSPSWKPDDVSNQQPFHRSFLNSPSHFLQNPPQQPRPTPTTFPVRVGEETPRGRRCARMTCCRFRETKKCRCHKSQVSSMESRKPAVASHRCTAEAQHRQQTRLVVS